MEVTIGFYCCPKREVLSLKSFIIEAALKLSGIATWVLHWIYVFWRIKCVLRWVCGHRQCHQLTCIAQLFFKSKHELYVLHYLMYFNSFPIFLQFFSKVKWLFFITNNYFLAYILFLESASLLFSSSSGLFFQREISLGLDFLHSLQIHFDLTLKGNSTQNNE